MSIQHIMVTKVQKWGNSLGVRLPKSVTQETRVSAGSEVDVSVKNGEIVIHRIRKQSFRLRDMLINISPKNIHSEISSGRAIGREVL